jgi:hypothetical protein
MRIGPGFEAIELYNAKPFAAVHVRAANGRASCCGRSAAAARVLPKYQEEFEPDDPDGPLCRVCRRVAPAGALIEGGYDPNHTYFMLDAQHQIIPVKEDEVLTVWAHWFNILANRQVGYTEIGIVHISTVFAGWDLSLGGSPPAFFQTAVGGPGGTRIAGEYTTWEQALLGHGEAVAQIHRERNSIHQN